MTDAVFRKELGCLRPGDDEAERVLRGLKMGECVTVAVKKPRNLQMHRLFYALMQKVFENQEHYAAVEHVVAAFKFHCGHTEKVKTRQGMIELPKSISFAAMNQDEFRAFFDKAVDFLCTEVLPGLGREELEREVMEMIQ